MTRRSHRFVAAFAVVCALAVPPRDAGAGDGTPARIRRWTLTDRAFGPVAVGMTVPQAEKAARLKLRADPADATEPCHYVGADVLPGVGFMVQDGRITRIDVSSGRHATVSGIRIGSAERELRATHPRLAETPGFYDPAERDLRVVSRDGKHSILFVVADGRVTAIRSGLREPVDYVEGCQ